MNSPTSGDGQPGESVNDLLLRLDRAMETLEGMDELEVETRAELVVLMDEIDRQISDTE